MTAYALTPVSFDGNALNDSNYVSWFLREDNIMGTVVAQAIDVDRPFSNPKTVGTQKQGKAYPLHIRLASGVDETKLNTLKQWFASSQTQKYLKVTNGAGTTLRVACVSRGLLATDNAVEWIANLWADDGTLEADSASTDTQHCVSVDNKAWTLTNNGSTNAKPKFHFDLTSAKEQAHDYRYFRWRNIISRCLFPLTDPDGGGWPTLVIQGWDTATLVTAGKALASGNDVRIFVDGIEVDRWFGTGTAAWNAAATNIWANIPWRVAAKGTLKTALDTSDPLVPNRIDITEGTADFPNSGYVALGVSSILEIFYYGNKDATGLANITRARRGTTAHSLSAGTGTFVVFMEHDIRILYGKTDAGAPPASADYKPIFDLSTSTNEGWKFPTDYISEGTHRTGQWQRAYQALNTLSPVLRGYETSSKMNVEDTPPSAGKPKRNVWYLNMPIGIGGADSIHHDVAVPAHMLLDVYGNDGEADVLLAQYNSDTDGDGKLITPPATVYGVQYRAKSRTVTAAEPTAITEDVYSLLDSRRAEQFTLDSVTVLTGIIVKLKRDGSATGYITAQIWLPQSGATGPEPANTMIYLGNAITVSDIGNGSYTEHLITFPTPITIPAGSSYYLNLERTTAPGNVWWQHGTGCYAKGSLWSKGGGTWTEHPEYDFWFRVLGDGSVCQPEIPTGTGDEVTVDDVELAFAQTALPLHSAAEADCYYFDGVLTVTHPDATVQTLTVAIPAQPGQEMEIDCAAKTIVNKTTGEVYALVASDGKDWLYLAPGANSLTWAEYGMVHTDIVSTYRDSYA